jgi:predicted TIM-barrel enzyme
MERFTAMALAGEPIVGGGAGTGLSAKCEEAGGIDLIVIYNSGRYRMAGRGSLAGLLAYGNANQIVVEMAGEVLPVVRHTPVLAGVNGTDPFLLRDRFLRELAELGFAGVQNFPTVGLIDGVFRANLEETGMGFGLEIELIEAAHRADLLTTPYVFSAADARAMTAAGADLIVCHMRVTAGGAIGARRPSRWTTASPSSTSGRPPPLRSATRCSCSATADRSPSPRTPRTSCAVRGTATASTGRAAWSDCPPSVR